MNIRHSAIAAVATGLMLVGGTPALAAQDQLHAAARPGDSQPAASTSRSRGSAQSDRRICVDAEMTGTRVKRRVCRTEAEWQAEGGLPSAD